MENVTVIDDEQMPVSDADMRGSADISELRGQPRVHMQYKLSETDIRAGKDLCKQFITDVIALKLPDTIKKKPELMQLVEMQQQFEQFTLQGMFAVVAQAVKLLSQLTVEDMIYTPEGLIDTFKIQAILTTQQHTMNILQQFNTHVRRLPGILMDMMYEVERQSIIEIQAMATEVEDKKLLPGNVSSKSMSQLLIEAQAELVQAEDDEQEEQEAEAVAEPAQPTEPTDEDDDDTTLEL